MLNWDKNVRVMVTAEAQHWSDTLASWVEAPVQWLAGLGRAAVSGGGWMLPIISNGQKIHWPEQKIIINDAVFASC